jgi:hypothetical protein
MNYAKSTILRADESNFHPVSAVKFSNYSFLLKSYNSDFMRDFDYSKYNFSGVDWQIFWDLAISHKINLIVYKNIVDSHLNIHLDCISETVSAYTLSQQKRGLFLTYELLKVIKFLEKSHVNAIPYKGAILSQVIYGSPRLRVFDDLDILLPFIDYLKPKLILASIDYQSPVYEILSAEQEQKIRDYFGEYVLVRSKGDVCIDVHRYLLGSGELTFPKKTPNFWNRLEPVTIAGHEMLTLSPHDLLLYLCMNALKDDWVILRYACDISELIRSHPNLNWQKLQGESYSLRIDRIFHMSLLIVHQILDTPVPHQVLRTAQEDYWTKFSANWICRKYMGQLGQSKPIFFSGFLLKLIALKYSRDRLMYLSGIIKRFSKLAFVVNYRDTNFIKLPTHLSFLYYIVRPIRFVVEHKMNLFKLLLK